MKSSLSLFAQIVQVIPRTKFARIVRQTSAQCHSKGFASWDQFIAMLFCQFAGSKSLREISDGLAVTCGKLNHLGMNTAPPKSTLAYANAHRPYQMFEQLFYEILSVCKAASPGKKRKFRFKNKLLSMDASIIDLCVNMFPWATFQQGKGAAKLHMLLDHDGYLPVFADLTAGNCSDLKVAQNLELPKGSIVAIDRGYIDYGMFQKWTDNGVSFVTRLKHKSAVKVVKELPLPYRNSNILADCLVKMTAKRVKKKCPAILRIIVVWDERNNKAVTFLTNNLKLAASAMSEIYRDRWEVELFFKVLKQHLKIKTFVGTSINAVKIQIWTALITLLIIKYLQFKSKCNLPLCRLVALLRLNLFTYRGLWDWLDNPFAVPPLEPPAQLELVFWTAMGSRGNAPRGAWGKATIRQLSRDERSKSGYNTRVNPSDVITCFSVALYSTWVYHKPTRCLFDAGEGVATSMGKKIFGIRHLFLTHGHEDHTAGISNLVNIRNIVSGEIDKPLTIYYPRHDPWVTVLLECIERKQTGLLRYPLYAQPLEPGDEIELEDTKRPTRVRAFEMQHARGQICLGYAVEQERKEMDVLGETTRRFSPIFLYTGDGIRPQYDYQGRIYIAMHEATFLSKDISKASAFEDSRHSTVEIALEWAASNDVKALILFHISERYTIEEVTAEALLMKSKFGFRGDLYMAYRDRIIRLGD